MGKRTKLNFTDAVRILRHLADVAAMKAEPVSQRRFLVDGLNKIVGTNQAFFFIADDWRVGGNPRWVHQTMGTDMDAVALQYMAEFGVRYPLVSDPYAARSIQDTASVQAITWRDAMPDRAEERKFGPFMDIVDAGRVPDGVVAFHRAGDDGNRIVGVGMHNFGGAGMLSERQVAMIRFAMTELKSLSERGHLPLPQVQRSADLSPRLRQILDLLLAGQQPKNISRSLGISIHTVREHISRIYRHFDVSGRDELMARFTT